MLSMAQGKLDDAAQTYRQALAIDPIFTNAHNSLGKSLDKQGLLQEATRNSGSPWPSNPIKQWLITKSEKSLLKCISFPQAVEELTQAAHSTQPTPMRITASAWPCFNSAIREAAIEQFKQALQIDPNYAEAKRNLDLAQEWMKHNKPGSGPK